MKWHIPFKGRNHSGVYDQNFLVQKGNIYVMDNHRAALWCWLHYFKGQFSNVGVCHIDRHSDALSSNLNNWVQQAKAGKPISNMTIDEYLAEEDAMHTPAKLYRWDNYLSMFLELYKSSISTVQYSYFEGDDIVFNDIEEFDQRKIPGNLSFWLDRGEWIVNIDLDYFFEVKDGETYRLFSDAYINSFFNEVRLLGQREDVVITICFSPECCGGWQHAEEVWAIADLQLGTKITLPAP